MQAVLSAILQTVLRGIMDWWKGEQAEAAKWAAKTREQQLESIKTGKAKEREYVEALAEARANPAQSGAMWNKKLATAALLLMIVLPLQGCFRFYSYTVPYRPVPPKIERPVLEDESPFNQREQKLAAYAGQLEVAYEKVRQEAIDSNEEHGYPAPEE